MVIYALSFWVMSFLNAIITEISYGIKLEHKNVLTSIFIPLLNFQTVEHRGVEHPRLLKVIERF